MRATGIRDMIHYNHYIQGKQSRGSMPDCTMGCLKEELKQYYEEEQRLQNQKIQAELQEFEEYKQDQRENAERYAAERASATFCFTHS